MHKPTRRKKMPETNNVGISTKNLLVACANADLPSIQGILADVRLRRSENTRRDNHNWTGLHHAIKSGDIECLRLMLSSPYVPIYAKTFEGQTALHLAVELQDRFEHIQLLMEMHPQLADSLNNQEVSAVQRAIELRRSDVARLIIELGRPNVNHFDLDHEHALYYAVRARDYSMVEYLLNETDSEMAVLNTNGMDVITIDLAVNREISSDARKHCLRLLFKRMYASNQCLRRIVIPMFACIRLDMNEQAQWVLQTFFMDPKLNAPYAAVAKRIYESPTLTFCSALAVCFPLHHTINPTGGTISKGDCEHYGRMIKEMNRRVLFCMFTVLIDDIEAYRTFIKPWWTFYIHSVSQALHTVSITDIITNESYMSLDRLHFVKQRQPYTTKQYQQIIKELSIFPTMYGTPLDRLFEKYILRTTKTHDEGIAAALIIYVTSPTPYDFICPDPDRRRRCNNVFRDSGCILSDTLAYKELHEGTRTVQAQPNTLFNLARTTVRATVFANSKPNPSEPDAWKLWRLELPLEVRMKLIYQYTSFGID